MINDNDLTCKHRIVGKCDGCDAQMTEKTLYPYAEADKPMLIPITPSKETVLKLCDEQMAQAVNALVDKATSKIYGAIKHDQDKPRFDLIPAEPLIELAKVFEMGSRKYSDRNWEKGMKWGRIFGALMRHAWAFWNGETHDKESGLHHMAHCAWGCLVLVEYVNKNNGEDDRK